MQRAKNCARNSLAGSERVTTKDEALAAKKGRKLNREGRLRQLLGRTRILRIGNQELRRRLREAESSLDELQTVLQEFSARERQRLYADAQREAQQIQHDNIAARYNAALAQTARGGHGN